MQSAPVLGDKNMASPISSGGFQVQAQPGINYLPPSQLSANLTGILPAISQGMGLVSQLQGIRDDAFSRPIKQQLQQIALQEAQAKLADNAANNRLKGLQIAHAAQPLERILGTDIKRVARNVYDTPALDEAGNPTWQEGDTNYDMVPVQRVEVTDPTSGEKTIIERNLTPIATSEQLGERQDKLEIARLREGSLSEQRKAVAELAAARLSSPDWARVGYGTNPAGKEVFVIMNKKTGQKQEIPTDLMPVQSGIGALTGVLQGLTGAAQSPTIQAPANIATPPALAAPVVAAEDTVAVDADTAVVDAETQALIDRLSAAATAPVAAPTSFKTPAEAEAAAAAGLIKKGQKITVGGRSATWQ